VQAELIEAAHVQTSRQARGFDLWVMRQGVGKRSIPARKHRAVHRALASPGATLCAQGEGFRKNGQWDGSGGGEIPLPAVSPAKEFIGVDIGVRAAVTRLDGYKGPALRPVLPHSRDRRARRQKHGVEESREVSPQKQVLAREARKVVPVCHRADRGGALADPQRLGRWKAPAARCFATRVALLASLTGVASVLIAPPYTRITCARCGSVEKRPRPRELFRCGHCGVTHHADFNASRVIAKRATRVSCESHHGSLSLCPSGGKAE